MRLLNLMEVALAAEDPKLVHTLSRTRNPRVHRRSALAGVGFFLGLGLLVGGMVIGTVGRSATGIAVSLAGFVLMVAAAVIGTHAWQHATGAQPEPGRHGRPETRPSSAGGSANGQGSKDPLDKRWRKRQDEPGS